MQVDLAGRQIPEASKWLECKQTKHDDCATQRKPQEEHSIQFAVQIEKKQAIPKNPTQAPYPCGIAVILLHARREQLKRN